MDVNKSENNTNKSTRMHLIIFWGFGAVVFVIMIYFSLVFFFRYHYLPGTIVDSVDCGYHSSEWLWDELNRDVDEYVISIDGKDGMHDEISANEIKLILRPDSEYKSILEKQNFWMWPIYLFESSNEFRISHYQYKEEDFNDRFEALCFFDQKRTTKGEDAHISEYNPQTGLYSIIPPTVGTIPNKDQFRAKLTAAIQQGEKSFSLEKNDCYLEPEIKSDSKKLNKTLETMNRYVSTRIVYDWNGREVLLDGAVISEWLSTDGKRVYLDDDMLCAWVEKQSEEYDTLKETRKFTTYLGEEKELKAFAFGWCTNKTAEAEALRVLVRSGAQENREPLYKMTGYKKGPDDMGDSYVEIDLSGQHLYLWIDGEVIFESDFVSGNMSRNMGTPSGIYGLTYREKEAVLRGENYTTPVHFWMPFNGNVGMHDATWRKEFGGEIYLTNGSHGCVNLPYSSAKQIFEYMEKRFPIICYY